MAFPTTDTLCCTCARAYALPDPDGCAFHRRKPNGKIEDMPFQESRIKKDKIFRKKKIYVYDLYVVTKCDNYRISTARPAINRGREF